MCSNPVSGHPIPNAPIVSSGILVSCRSPSDSFLIPSTTLVSATVRSTFSANPFSSASAWLAYAHVPPFRFSRFQCVPFFRPIHFPTVLGHPSRSRPISGPSNPLKYPHLRSAALDCRPIPSPSHGLSTFQYLTSMYRPVHFIPFLSTYPPRPSVPHVSFPCFQPFVCFPLRYDPIPSCIFILRHLR